MIGEKSKQREVKLGDSISLDHSSSPPSLHKKWRRARQRKRCEFTLKATREVVENIVSRYFFNNIYWVKYMISPPAMLAKFGLSPCKKN